MSWVRLTGTTWACTAFRSPTLAHPFMATIDEPWSGIGCWLMEFKLSWVRLTGTTWAWTAYRSRTLAHPFMATIDEPWSGMGIGFIWWLMDFALFGFLSFPFFFFVREIWVVSVGKKGSLKNVQLLIFLTFFNGNVLTWIFYFILLLRFLVHSINCNVRLWLFKK